MANRIVTGLVIVGMLSAATPASAQMEQLLGGALGMFLNGAGIVREQTVVVLVFCALLLPFKVWAVGQWGLIAVPLCTAGVFLLTHLTAYGYVFLPKIQSIWAEEQLL